MPGRIQLLPPALADQIAAGEVVERPASVLKELVENALDAGATRIEVEIERGGLGLIAVSDDGEGMSAEDAHLALRRHATSKLRHADDLFALSSFGFRGEALPSIASVSELSVRTRQKTSTAGYEIVARGGETVTAREVGAPPGTRVEVRALFANVPARLKFQKTQATEAAQVLDALVRTALSAPTVYLRLRVDGRIALELPSHATLGERAIAVMRRSLGRAVRVATYRLEEGRVAVEVHLAPPSDAVQSARRVQLLVNRRVVRDRGLLSAIQVGLAERVAHGKYPQAIVSVHLPPADVDVNVHPQKIEVRLLRAAEVHSTVRHAIARAVAQHPVEDQAPHTEQHRYAADTPIAMELHEEEVVYGEERGRAFELIRAMAGDEVDRTATEATKEPAAPRFLGSMLGGHLVFTDASGLLLVDQHVASALVAASSPEQGTALPAPIPLAHDLLTAASTHAAALISVGFIVEHGALRMAPTWAEPALDGLRELIVAAQEGGAVELRERAATLAARSPVHEVSLAEATALYEALDELAREGVLPALHQAQFRGRRLLLRLGRAELARRLDE